MIFQVWNLKKTNVALHNNNNFKNNTVHALGLLKVEFGCSYMKPKLFEKDVVVGSMYVGLKMSACQHNFKRNQQNCPSYYYIHTIIL